MVRVVLNHRVLRWWWQEGHRERGVGVSRGAVLGCCVPAAAGAGREDVSCAIQTQRALCAAPHGRGSSECCTALCSNR